MDLELIREELKCVLKPIRYQHSLGVEEVACDLAVIYEYDMEKARLAGLLHDCARGLSDEQLLEKCKEYGLPVTEIEQKCGFLLHGKVGALYARQIYEVLDEEILNSIRYHTTGRPAMILLEKIIFIADYIEPNRRPLPRINEIRLAAYTDLDLGITMVLENMLNYFKESGTAIDTLTVDTYEYYKAYLQTRRIERGL